MGTGFEIIPDGTFMNDEYAVVGIPKIINGSILSVGDKVCVTKLPTDQHFNWFQKLMWKWCFGVKVKDYSQE